MFQPNYSVMGCKAVQLYFLNVSNLMFQHNVLWAKVAIVKCVIILNQNPASANHCKVTEKARMSELHNSKWYKETDYQKERKRKRNINVVY